MTQSKSQWNNKFCSNSQFLMSLGAKLHSEIFFQNSQLGNLQILIISNTSVSLDYINNLYYLSTISYAVFVKILSPGVKTYLKCSTRFWLKCLIGCMLTCRTKKLGSPLLIYNHRLEENQSTPRKTNSVVRVNP